MSRIGKIKTVFCKHFVTYNECIFKPTEYLNIIIGPNGTGKSTLVAAIVLGLGGEPKLLARTSSLEEYVKNGFTCATIQVEIFVSDTENKTTTFQRMFSNAGKSEYSINAETVSKNVFLQEVSKYNIQIRNLCQFLPQDRVQDFAKMNPQEILLNTMNSVCRQELVQHFSRLKELRNIQVSGKNNLKNLNQKLEESLLRLDELQQNLDRFNARKQYLAELKICNAKKIWLKIDEIEVKIAECSADLSEARKSFSEHEKLYNMAKKKQELINKVMSELRQEALEKEKYVKASNEEKSRIIQKIEELKHKIEEAKVMHEKRKHDWCDRQSELKNEIKMLEVIAQDLQNAKLENGADSEREEELRTCDKKIDHLKLEVKQLQSEHSSINQKLDENIPKIQMLKRNIELQENVFEQKLQLLKTRFPDVYTAIEWLQENSDLFIGRVYKPMILELNVRDPNHAKYFENTIPLRDLLAFTCENKSDLSLLVDELCVKRKLSVNVGHTPPPEECNFISNVPIAHLKRFGFEAYLTELIEGPQAVLNYLCSLYNLHNIPIGSEQVNKWTDQVSTRIRQYFGGDQRYNVSVSKYSKEPSLIKTHIKGKQLLSSIDENEIKNLKKRLDELLSKNDKLKNARSLLEARINENEQQCKEARNKKQTINGSILRLKQLYQQMKRQHEKVVTLKKSMIEGLPELEKGFETIAVHAVRDIMELQRLKLGSLKIVQKAKTEFQIAQTKICIYGQEHENVLNSTIKEGEQKIQAQKLVETILKKLTTLQQERDLKKEEAKSLTGNIMPDDVNYPDRCFYNNLPNNLEELEDVINDYSGRLDCMDDVNPETVSEYETRVREVEDLNKEIRKNKHKDENLASEIDLVYVKWHPEICAVVDTINRNFGNFMKSMNYIGEVVLTNNDKLDFDSYGIQIMVQYRKNVQLQPLNRHVQSGGERAVAIAVYTLSMQHITHVPFRCVDEINQGMDAKNERRIFEMLVDETTKTGGAQYFFVTPKLLHNLKTNERMSVHVVFNGKMVQPQNAFEFVF